RGYHGQGVPCLLRRPLPHTWDRQFQKVNKTLITGPYRDRTRERRSPTKPRPPLLEPARRFVLLLASAGDRHQLVLLRSGLGSEVLSSRKLQHRRLLSYGQGGEKPYLAIWKFQRVVVSHHSRVDLPEDRGSVRRLPGHLGPPFGQRPHRPP